VITLINPPNPSTGISNKDMMGGFGQLYLKNKTKSCRVPALDILYTAAVLRDNKFSVNIIDCLGLNYGTEELLEALKADKPEIIGLRTSTPTFKWDLDIALQIKDVIESKLILFGSHASLFFKEVTVNDGIDAIILGEPELTFLDIAKKGSFEGVNGVYFKHGNSFQENPIRPFIEDLDNLPFPAWDLVPYNNYDSGELNNNYKPFLTVLASRGCPFQCYYCPYPVTQGYKWRARSANNVVKEIEYLITNFKPRYLLFRDPEFTLDKERVSEICKNIIKRKIKIPWRCETRIDTLDKDLIGLMAKAGCIGINMGIESADDSVLRKVGRKPFEKSNSIQVIGKCKEVGIETFCFFIIGLPGDTEKSILNTINLSLELNPSFAQFSIATPYPATKLRAWAIENSFLENYSFDELTGYNAVMRNENLSLDSIQQLHKFANRMWKFGKRGRKERIIKKGLPQGIKEAIKFILFWLEKLRMAFWLEAK